MTRYATAFKGLRVVKLKKKDKKIEDALKSIRNGKLCSSLPRYASDAIKKADIVLLAYNSEGVVKGLAGIDEHKHRLYVSIICNVMGKKNREEGYAPGRGLLDLLKKIAVKKKKNLTLSALNHVVNYYKRFGFKQRKSGNKTDLMWQWNPSYSRARRQESQSVNSNYNSNNNKPTIYRRTRGAKRRASPASSRASPTSSNRSSATVKRRKSKASPTSSRANFDKEIDKEMKLSYKHRINYQKERARLYKGRIIGAKRSRHMFKDVNGEWQKNIRNKYLTLLKNTKSRSIAMKKGIAADLKNFKRRLKE